MNEKISVGDKDVIFLLGAGCSYDATVPISKDMIAKLEELLKTKHEDIYTLYRYVKYTMEYGNKMFERDQDFNIESLMVTLHTIASYKKTIYYPFISGYTNELYEYAGDNFSNIDGLIHIIEEELPNWVTLDSYSSATYYKNFGKFQKELTYGIRIFSLNYDLCLEENVDCKVETGFCDDKAWDGNRFNQSENDEETAIYLYKLHGSINWQRKDGQLKTSSKQKIKPDIIFGTDVKLQAIDPYLFYLYEFRKYALLSKIIITIGYSFNDNHINDLVRQAIVSDETKKLLIVEPTTDEENEIKRIRDKFSINNADSRIIIENIGAKDFLNEKLTLDYVGSKLPQDELPF
ncbi:MAG: hypothetical protein BWY15_01730 [Firmicutes bacterium ADurb.Bin193]|nr:MAG: hypothetical protein BWY15_01730 [Firmicutes bacterium ADurb.Bin193]